MPALAMPNEDQPEDFSIECSDHVPALKAWSASLYCPHKVQLVTQVKDGLPRSGDSLLRLH